MAGKLGTPTQGHVSLRPEPASAEIARAFIEMILGTSAADDAMLIHDAMLLTTELVTNVILHARSRMTVTAAVEGDSLRVAVSDGSEEAPVRRQGIAPPEAEGGRGLQLVDAIAAAWGVEPVRGGKSVWFELAG